MYQITNKINLVESKPSFIDDTFVVFGRTRGDWRGLIRCYSISNNNIIWQINDVYGATVYNNEIITENLDVYDKKRNAVFSINNSSKYNFNLINSNGIIISNTNESGQIKYHLFDINYKEFICSNMILEGNTMVIISNYLIIRKPNATLQIYDYTQSSVVWEKEFSEIASYNDPLHDTPMRGEISRVYLYKENRIIVCTRYKSTYCFELTTGKQIWESKSYAKTIEIVGEMGYVCTGLCLYKLNLETGELSEIYPESKGRMPDIIRGEDDVLWPSGHKVVYHDGLLWYSMYSSGCSYLLAINPHDGHYEWIHEVKTHEKTDSPKFYKDKMYITDTGGTLHIYQKDQQ